MARKVPSSSADPSPITPDHIESIQFRVFNRLAATKPLREVLGLIQISDETTARRLFSSDDEDADNTDQDGHLHIASAFQPDVFGIRIGMRVETENHVFVLDTAVEYTLASEILYTGTEFEQFVVGEAAPRAAISTWTALEELAQSVDSPPDAPVNLAIPPQMVADAVINQQRQDTQQH